MPVEILRPGHQDALNPYVPRESFRFPAEGAAVGQARRRVRSTLDRWGLAGLCDDAGVVVTELFTNAIRHTASERVDVVLWTAARSLYLEVVDQGGAATSPVARSAEADDESGRGLMLVTQLTERWGVRPPAPGRGRAVWAALPFPGRTV